MAVKSIKKEQGCAAAAPLAETLLSSTDVVELIRRVFEDIRDNKRLSEFRAAKRMRRGTARALVDAVILQPQVGGVGFDVQTVFEETKDI